MFTDKAFSTEEEEDTNEPILRKDAMDLKFLCLALELKWKNAFDAKKQIDFLGISLKDDWAFPKTSSTLATFTGVKMDTQKFAQWKTDFLKAQETLQAKLCTCMFSYYDQDNDGVLSKKEIAMLLNDIAINNDEEAFWKDPKFLDITEKRVGKLYREKFKLFYDAYINSDLSAYHEEICFEMENKSTKFTGDKFEKLMDGIKEISTKNVWKDVEIVHTKLAEIYENETYFRKPLMQWFDLVIVDDEEKDFDTLNEAVQGGKGLTLGFCNTVFNYYDKGVHGYLLPENIVEALKDFGVENPEERTQQYLTRYYDEYLGDVLCFFQFGKVFHDLFKSKGIRMNLGDFDVESDEEDGENLFNGGDEGDSD
jgi:Ca2+-binding EF-hand superfamily protein